MSNMSLVYDAIRTSGGKASTEVIRAKTGLTRQQVSSCMSQLEIHHHAIKRSMFLGRCFGEITGKYRDIRQEVLELFEDNPESSYTTKEIKSLLGVKHTRIIYDRVKQLKKKGLVDCHLKEGTEGIYLWRLINVTSENLPKD